MKNLITTILISVVTLMAEYNIYDIAKDISWNDSDGGVPVQRSVYELVDQGKVVLLTWGYNT
jgi:hypothetical protein